MPKSTNNVKLIKLCNDDTDSALRLIKETMPKSVYEDAVEAFSNSPYSEVWAMFGIVLEDDVGCKNLVSVSGYAKIRGKFYVSWTATDPDYQESGYCSRLIRKVCREVKKQGGKEVSVETYEHPAFFKAITFYRKRGFRLYKFCRNYLEDGSSALYLRKRLISRKKEHR